MHIHITLKFGSARAGCQHQPSKKGTAWGAYEDDKTITVDVLLADEAREDGWFQAIAEFQTAATKSLGSGSLDANSESAK